MAVDLSDEAGALVATAKGPRVASVGLTILDILGRPVERIPDGGNVAFIDEIRLTVAGTAAGTVIDMAKLGLDALCVAAVGNDEKGRFVINTMQHFGVDTSGVQVVDGVPTSATILNIRPNGDRPALHQRGASDHLRVPSAVMDDVAACEYVHVGGSGLLRSFDGPPTTDLLRRAKTGGATTTFDLIAPDENTINLLRDYLPSVDYFMPSMEEAEILSGLSNEDDIARYFLDLGAGACVFKWGSKGSFFADAESRYRVPAFKVDVKDTTGCGDAYCAGFIAGLANGFAVEKACSFASACAGLVATGLGSDAGIVDFDSTLAFMNSATRLA